MLTLTVREGMFDVLTPRPDGPVVAPEIVLLLEAAGFREIELEAAYETRPATADDDTP